MIATGQTVAIHPSSVLCGKKAECVVFNELVRQRGRGHLAQCVPGAMWCPTVCL